MKRLRYRVIVVLLIGALLAGALKIYQSHKLDAKLRDIEDAYASTITLVEKNARELHPFGDATGSLGAFDARANAMNEMERALSGPEIYSAWWSLDGVHVVESLSPYPMPEGFSTSDALFSAAGHSGSHSLWRGKTESGRSILIFRGRVPDGVKRDYVIVFLADELEKR